jgi:hypothetical protein
MRASAQGIGRGRWQGALVHRLDDRPGRAADDIEQQFRRALHGTALQPIVHAALEAVRGIRVQPQGAGLAVQGHRGKKRRFQQELRVPSPTAEAAPPMMPASASGPRWSAITRLSSRSVIGLVVEQRELSPASRLAHDNAALQLVEVEGVHGLAEFEEQVVGDIDDRRRCCARRSGAAFPAATGGWGGTGRRPR